MSILLAGIALASQPLPIAMCLAYDGAAVVTHDGVFLGNVGDASRSDSIFNRFGDHGRADRPDSIWNRAGRYGGGAAPASAFNPQAAYPPRLMRGPLAIGVLSVAPDRADAVNPLTLGAVCYHYFPD